MKLSDLVAQESYAGIGRFEDEYMGGLLLNTEMVVQVHLKNMKRLAQTRTALRKTVISLIEQSLAILGIQDPTPGQIKNYLLDMGLSSEITVDSYTGESLL